MPRSQAAAANTAVRLPSQKARQARHDKESARQLRRIFAVTSDELEYMNTKRDYGCPGTGIALLPTPLVNALIFIRFLTATVVSAQLAERAHGVVPASALLAVAMYDSGYNAMTFARDHGYEGPENSPGYRLAIDGAFLKEAKSLARSRRLRPALQAAADPCAYLKKL